MTALQPSVVGALLDEDHAPETNGRMAVCRRCGTHTDTPAGLHHVPHELQVVRSNTWLIGEVSRKRNARARELLN